MILGYIGYISHSASINTISTFGTFNCTFSLVIDGYNAIDQFYDVSDHYKLAVNKTE